MSPSLVCTPAQLDTLRHMLGINDPSHRIPKPHRNYAAVIPGDAHFVDLARLGLVECCRKAGAQNSYDYYRCTDAGRAAAMARYKTIRLSKSKRVYLKFLGLKDVLAGLTFRDFLVDPQFAVTRRNA